MHYFKDVFFSMNSCGWTFTNFRAEWLNEFSHLYHVFKKRDSYVNLCKLIFGRIKRDAFFRFIPN